MGDEPLWWLVYVRWPTGKRETIRTQFPEQMLGYYLVLACLPEPTVSLIPGRVRYERHAASTD